MNEGHQTRSNGHPWLDGVCAPSVHGATSSPGLGSQSTQAEGSRWLLQENATKRLAAIAKLAFNVIPRDPSRAEYCQGTTLGANRKHWFRAKVFQQYRLFFRYHAGAKMIVYAWVNDDNTKRAYESSDDAYRVFRKMLESGHPPDDWDQLLNQAKLAGNRLEQAFSGLNTL